MLVTMGDTNFFPKDFGIKYHCQCWNKQEFNRKVNTAKYEMLF